MASPDEYRRQVSALGFDNLTITASNSNEAKSALANVRNAQKELRQIKRNINLDIKTIRAEYREKKSNAGTTSSALFSVFGKRKVAGQIRADAKRRLTREMENNLGPYENLKLTIDDLMVQLDSAKVQLQNFIEEVKQEESKRQSSPQIKRLPSRSKAKFCTQCGQQVGASDKFCRECGHAVG